MSQSNNKSKKTPIPNSPRPVFFFDQKMPTISPREPLPTLPIDKPLLSIIVMVYKMSAQAKKTLLSLSTQYQQGVSEGAYEVIVVENESTDNLSEEEVRQFGSNFRYFRRQETRPSPVFSVNFAARQAKGEMIGVMIDGARMVTPGVVSWILAARRLSPNAIAAVPGYHLGAKVQQEAAKSGYNAETEQQLLDSINWPHDGYKLFNISVLSGTSANGVFKPIGESNLLCLPRAIWDELGGCDERFDETGGGQVNLDLYKRACELPQTLLVMLLGEGTFHQFHGGITTGGTKDEERYQVMLDHFAQYASIRGESYQAPLKRCIYLGAVPDSAQKFIYTGSQRVRQLLGELPGGLNPNTHKKKPAT